jgi:hypothetical protein
MKKFINSSLKYLGAIILFVSIALAFTNGASAAGIPDFIKNPETGAVNTDTFCKWRNTSSLDCGTRAGSRGNFSLDLNSSLKAGHLVFAVDYGTGAAKTAEQAATQFGFVHISLTKFNDATITTSPTDPTGGATIVDVNDDQIPLSGTPERTDPPNACSLTNWNAGCINAYIQSYDNVNTLSQGDVDKVKAIYDEMIKNAELLNSCDNSNAPLPFIFCPILNGITNAIGGLIGGAGQVEGPREGLLISFLSLPPISSEPGSVLSTVLGNVVDIANILYILIFLVLIFAGSIPFLNLDSYTIKKTLPKFILAVILTQFSLQICSIIVDFFNLLGLAIPNVLFGISQGAQNAALTAEGVGTVSKVASGVGGTVVAGGIIAGGAAAASSIGWILILLIAIAALIAAIVAIVYLLIRYFVLFTLVIISPIAFVSWVLPGTEKFFKQWWTNFIKLNAMFVTIMAMLSASIVLSAILAKLPGSNNGALIASIIPIIALLLVPKTLKWTTQGMNGIATGALNAVGKAGGKAASTGKGYVGKRTKEGVSERKEQFAANQFGMGRTRTAKMFGGRYAGRLPGKVAGKAKEEAGYEYAGMGNPDEVGAKLQGTMDKLAKRPFDAKLRGEAHAGLARLGQLGGGGRAQIASLQDSYRAAGGEAGNWKGLLGDSGIMGDMDAKAPELTSWEGNSSGFSDYTAANGETYKVRRSGAVDLQGKGATELGQLGASTIASAHQTTDRSEQFDKLNWQAAATMASTPQLQPKDGNSIAEWNKLASAAISHWDQVGIDAANRGDQAAFDRAVQNQNHAQTILDSLGS